MAELKFIIKGVSQDFLKIATEGVAKFIEPNNESNTFTFEMPSAEDMAKAAQEGNLSLGREMNSYLEHILNFTSKGLALYCLIEMMKQNNGDILAVHAKAKKVTSENE